ncbi:MAG: DUF222 domain-containing protein [Acidimicrobiales bacterium]
MFDKAIGLREVKAQETAVAGLCAAFDPDAIPLADIAAVHASVAHMEKLIAGARLRLARRVEESGVWRQQGFPSAAHYLARQTGSTVGAAQDTLAASKQLPELPSTEEAVRRGKLSPTQTAAVADGARANPGAEPRLLGKAAHHSITELREEVRRTKAAADPDPETTYRRIHDARGLRRFTDAEGAYNLHLRTVPDAGAQIDAILQPVIDRLFHQARVAGRREPVEAYAADALVEVVSGAGGDTGQPTRRRQSKVIATIDYEALKRGYAQSHETCEIAGVGAVPVSTVRAMLTDAFLALIVTDGVDVYNVAHAGRQVTAHQRTALEARGYRCEIPGCAARHNLELDHITGWALTRRTALDDLAWQCPWHHHLKTHCGYRLEGPPGQRRWLGPDRTEVDAEHVPPTTTGPPPKTSDPPETLFDRPGAA